MKKANSIIKRTLVLITALALLIGLPQGVSPAFADENIEQVVNDEQLAVQSEELSLEELSVQLGELAQEQVDAHLEEQVQEQADVQLEEQVEEQAEVQSEVQSEVPTLEQVEVQSEAQPQEQIDVQPESLAQEQIEAPEDESVQKQDEASEEEQTEAQPEGKTKEALDDKSVDKSEDGAGAGSGDGQKDPAQVLDEDSLKVSHTESPADGAQNRYKFSFSDSSETPQTYSAFVYGTGVDAEICKLLAMAYFDGLTETAVGNKVVDPNFVDANKYSVTDEDGNHDYYLGYDSNLCWAYAASNALTQTNWLSKVNAGIFNTPGTDNASAYFKNEDDIASYAAYCLKDVGDDESNFWSWIFTGFFPRADKLVYGQDADDALLREYINPAANNIYEKDAVNNHANLIDVIKRIENDGAAASTLGIYHIGTDGGHALTLTGFIKDASGEPVAVIVANSDDVVGEEPDNGSQKKKAYSVFPIVYENNQWRFKPNDYYNSEIGDISILNDSQGNGKISESIIPVTTRAISDSFDNGDEHSFDSTYSFDIPLNFDFLSFYDIKKLKYRLLNESDEVIAEDTLERSKSEWTNLFNSGAVSVSLGFADSLSEAADGNYRIQVDIDKDCFYGNYGWFAQRYNEGKGYVDTLVDTWVRLFRESSDPIEPVVPGDTDSEDYEDYYYDSDYYDSYYYDEGAKSSDGEDDEYLDEIEQSILDAVLEALINEIFAQLDLDYNQLISSIYGDVAISVDGASVPNGSVVSNIKNEKIEDNIKSVVNDFLKANAQDEATVSKFKAIGVDVSKLDVQKMKVVMSSSIKMTKAGKVKFACKNRKFTTRDTVIAMIELSDGTVGYVKAKVLSDGSLELVLPANVVEITILTL